MKIKSFLSLLLPVSLVSLTPSAVNGQNTSYGSGALPTNSGAYNTAVGLYTLYGNTSGLYNNGVGTAALVNNTSGSNNTAVGLYSCYGNTTGVNNCGFGNQTLQFNTVGNGNVAIGLQALLQCTGSNNIGIGTQGGFLLTNGNNNICIGNPGVAAESGVIRIGTEGLHSVTRLAGNVFTDGVIQGRAIVASLNGVASNGPVITGAVGPGFRHIVGSTELHSWVTDGIAAFGTTTNHALELMTNASTKMIITNDGLVGIGITNPAYPLHVVGTRNFNPGTNLYGFGSFSGFRADSIPLTTSPLSIFASSGILASYYVANSDARIKKIVGQSDSASDLSTLLGIQITDYTHIDTVTKGGASQKKVIAQQVEKVYPQAVHLGTDVVPDIYKMGAVKDGWVKLATNLKKGERVRLIGEKKESLHEVLEVEADRFRTDFVADGKEVFVYGREVNDFRSVDYEAISMLNVSATQELARKLAAKDAEIAALKEQLAAQAAKDKAFEARLAFLEQSTSGAVRAVKVAATK